MQNTVEDLLTALDAEDGSRIQTLLRKGLSLRPGSAPERLLVVALTGTPQELEALLRTGVGPDPLYGPSRTSLLIYVSRYGPPSNVKLLLEAGANPNSYYKGLPWPLIDGILGGNLESVRLLIDYGAEVDSDWDERGSPLEVAASESSVEIVRLLIQAGADLDGDRFALHAALAANKAQNVEALVQLGAADVWSALHYCSHGDSSGIMESINALFRAIPDKNQRFEDGVTPLMLAARYASPAAIESLLLAGADPRARTIDGQTAFDFATGNAMVKGTDTYWRLNDMRFYPY